MKIKERFENVDSIPSKHKHTHTSQIGGSDFDDVIVSYLYRICMPSRKFNAHFDGLLLPFGYHFILLYILFSVYVPVIVLIYSHAFNTHTHTHGDLFHSVPSIEWQKCVNIAAIN